MSPMNLLIWSTLSRMSRRCCSESLEGKNGLFQGLIFDGWFEPFRRREIDLCSKQISKPVFEPAHGQQSLASRFVKFGEEIDIGPYRLIAARHRTKYRETNNSGSLQFSFVLTQCSDYVVPAHGP